MRKEEKQEIVEEFIGIFDKPGVYLMDFKGLNVAEITELRSKLREASVSMRVVKNTLAKRALEKAGIDGFDGYFTGPTGVVWSHEDSIAPSRILLEYLKKFKKGSIKAGLIEGTVFGDDEINTISKLPTKQELYQQTASVLVAPIVMLARTLNSIPLKFVKTVDALRVKNEQK